MIFKPIDTFTQVLEELFNYVGLEHKFMAEIPESSLNTTEDVNVLIWLSGEITGNIVFCHPYKSAIDIAGKFIGSENLRDIDTYAKAALCDFYAEFTERFVNFIKITNMYNFKKDFQSFNVQLSPPIFITGKDLYGLVNKNPAKKLFFKVEGEKFGIAYNFLKND